MTKKVLIAGESWMSYTTHVKGFDAFYTSVYEEGVEYLRYALESGGYEVVYLPNHHANDRFPYTMDELRQYACIILSDIGSNTLLLPSQTFIRSEERPNRCQLIKDYVLDGGAFLMIGGYMSFTGIDGKSRYGQTPVKDILPVKCLGADDREEHSEGLAPKVVKEHPVVAGLPKEWPNLLGYNKTVAINGYDVVATINNDPLIAVGDFEKGRAAVFTSDCAPHWAPLSFVKWPNLLGYNKTVAINGYDVVATINNDPLIAVGDFEKGRAAVFTSDCAPHWAPLSFVKWPYYNQLWKNILDYIVRN